MNGNWLKFLDRAIADPPSVSARQHTKAIIQSEEWPTCACGQLCKKLPRQFSGAPEDAMLWSLGISFSVHVDKKDWDAAKETFLKIEARTTQLLKEDFS